MATASNERSGQVHKEIETTLRERRGTEILQSQDHGHKSEISGLSLESVKCLSRQSTLVGNDGDRVTQPLNRVHSIPARLGQKICSLDCNCVCHRRNRLKSPNVLSTVLGSLFVGYKASPWSSQHCDKRYCQSQATKITYAFPQWLLRRAISVSMTYSHPQGPDFCLRMMRVRPGDADIFTAVFRGTYNHVQRLLDDNDASVLDVDPAHNTALQVRSSSDVRQSTWLR